MSSGRDRARRVSSERYRAMLAARPFVIAEMANAHEGDLARARRLVDAAADAGADAVKFQKFTGAELLVPQHPRYQHFCDLEMKDTEWADLIAHARTRGLAVLADVFGPESATLMHELDIDGYKIHSSDTINVALLRQVAAYGRPVFLSCGGSKQIEIRDAIRTLRAAGNDEIVLLHGFQSYPTRLEDANLRRIGALAEQFRIPVGYADHVAGDSEWAVMLPVMAVGAGAVVIEKHITDDRARKGIDYFSSAEPAELKRLVPLLRDAARAMGDGAYAMSEDELTYMHQVKKALVAATDLKAGTPLTEASVTYKRAPSDAHPLTFDEVRGKALRVALAADTVLTLDRFEQKCVILVAARMHSTRLPRKALLPLAQRPAITHLFDRLRGSRRAAGFVLCTSTHPDDTVLAELAAQHGVSCFRGSEDDVLERFLDAAGREQADVIARVTGDDLLIDTDYIDRAFDFHLAHNADYTAYPGLPKGMETEIMSVRALRACHEMAEDPSVTEYLTYFIKRPDVFRVSTMPVDERHRRAFRLTLDQREDYEVLTAIFDALYRPGAPFGTEDVIAFLDARPELLAKNAAVRGKAVSLNTNLRINA